MTKIEELEQIMVNLSERCYCAQWLDGIEFVLWDFVEECRKKEWEDKDWGQNKIKAWELLRLYKLSKEVDGWWFWLEDVGKCFTSRENFKEYAGDLE